VPRLRVNGTLLCSHYRPSCPGQAKLYSLPLSSTYLPISLSLSTYHSPQLLIVTLNKQIFSTHICIPLSPKTWLCYAHVKLSGEIVLHTFTPLKVQWWDVVTLLQHCLPHSHSLPPIAPELDMYSRWQWLSRVKFRSDMCCEQSEPSITFQLSLHVQCLPCRLHCCRGNRLFAGDFFTPRPTEYERGLGSVIRVVRAGLGCNPWWNIVVRLSAVTWRLLELSTSELVSLCWIQGRLPVN
jgi:hypothetical protein